jgi:hypothetical protein
LLPDGSGTLERITTVKAKLLLMTCCLAAATAQAGRFEGLTQRFSKGEKMTPVAATFFGGSGGEEFVDVGQLPDGTIVAFGNSTGPDFRATPKPVVLGLGKHQKLEPYVTEKNDKKTIAAENPDLAGMLVFYDEKLSRVLKTVKFDWGVASLSLGAVGEDGQSLFVAGRCTEAFRALAKTAKSFKVEPYVAPPPPEVVPGKKVRKSTAPAVGPYNYQGATHPGDVFVAKLAPTGDKLEWVWIFEGLRKPPEQIWTDKKGSLYFEVRGMRRITADGQKAALINAKIGGASPAGARWTRTTADRCTVATAIPRPVISRTGNLTSTSLTTRATSFGRCGSQTRRNAPAVAPATGCARIRRRAVWCSGRPVTLWSRAGRTAGTRCSPGSRPTGARPPARVRWGWNRGA